VTADALSLLDWKRAIGELFAEIRATPDKHAAWNHWRETSCAYDPSWTCPLTPPANRLPVAVRAGERVTAG
jgi:Protein of unknown function (DUF1684)